MFEPDEYIFTKLAYFFKRRRKKSEELANHKVTLGEMKSRLTILARAITGEPIELFEAEREGGYKDNNFFLPSVFSLHDSAEKNITIYIFRTLYLCVQKRLDFNFKSHDEITLEVARQRSQDTSQLVLKEMYTLFPGMEQIHHRLKDQFAKSSPSKQQTDYSFLYGKWMKNSGQRQESVPLNNFNEKAKKAIEDEIKTVIKAQAVEEVISVQVDNKAQEDYTLTHNFEKVETAEEFDGGWRDFDGDDDLDDHSNALEELNMKYTVRVDDMTHSVYQADFIENTTVSESSETDNKAFHLTYDEWDYSKRRYKPDFCKVFPETPTNTDISYYKKALQENASTLLGLRKMLTSVNNKYQQQRRQSRGEDFDLDATTDLFVDLQSGHSPSENIYLSRRKKEKDISILLLLDVSLSSDGYAAGNKVIDVEKQVSIIFGEILNEFNVDFSINGFFSKTRNHTSYLTLKGFDENWQRAKLKIGAIAPGGYTRIGTALRHSGALLDKRQSKNKWVILISDGKPNDYDRYEGRYGINDVKQALRELNQRHIHSYALAIEAQAKYYLPQMFGQNHYQILTTPVALLQSLVKLYDRIKHQS